MCLSTSINTWFSIRSLDWPRREQLCSWPVLSACLRYDVTTTKLWCMIMNEFPVCVFAWRHVDFVNLFIFKWIYVEITKTLNLAFVLDVFFDVNTNFKPLNVILNLVVRPKPWFLLNFSAEHHAAGTPHEVMNGRGFTGLLVEWLCRLHPEGELKSPSMHTGPWVKWLTYKCSLVAACRAGIGWANQIWVVLKAEEGSRWMDGKNHDWEIQCSDMTVDDRLSDNVCVCEGY